VEGIPDKAALDRLSQPLNLGDFVTQPCKVMRIQEPEWLWERNPPIRQRANIPTSWLAMVLSEGKNRQVRRMTAAVGFPTLRLVRTSIAGYALENSLMPGDWVEVDPAHPLK
jgi:23S rRNA pseudouridine2457 synthase